ncbi:hypothetical protein HK102_006142, partial [Quaeritorhiza haematococci]
MVFDLVVPAACIGSLILCFIGPLFIPKIYLLFLLTYFSTVFCISFSHFFKLQLTLGRIRRTIRMGNAVDAGANGSDEYSSMVGGESGLGKDEISSSTTSTCVERERGDRERDTTLNNTTMNNTNMAETKILLGPTTTEIAHTHIFIVPNYKEPLPLLQRTVGHLASHRAAKTNYVVVLAMEESEQGCEAKALTLKNEFDGMFREVIYTIHPANVPGEARGKGSNENYAVRQACAALIRKSIPMKQMIVTISDADAAIPELYIREIERAIVDMPPNRDPLATVFCPPMFFSRNSHQVPAPVRIYDIMWSVMVMQNLSNMRGICFPCSTYSLSMVLADRVGYWDPDTAAIGEDMHMALKCFFKAGARGHPIYVPINLTNVQTTGYLSNIHARFVQARRHFMGVADVAYTLQNALRVSPNAWNRMTLGEWFDRVL